MTAAEASRADVVPSWESELSQKLFELLHAGDLECEEFVLMLPPTPKTGAREVAERARQTIEREEMRRGDRLTVSMGIATFPADAEHERELLRHADRAMYLAKAEGKNQVQLYGEDRRSSSRVRAALSGEFRRVGRRVHSLMTTDVSGGGAAVQLRAGAAAGLAGRRRPADCGAADHRPPRRPRGRRQRDRARSVRGGSARRRDRPARSPAARALSPWFERAGRNRGRLDA